MNHKSKIILILLFTLISLAFENNLETTTLTGKDEIIAKIEVIGKSPENEQSRCCANCMSLDRLGYCTLYAEDCCRAFNKTTDILHVKLQETKVHSNLANLKGETTFQKEQESTNTLNTTQKEEIGCYGCGCCYTGMCCQETPSVQCCFQGLRCCGPYSCCYLSFLESIEKADEAESNANKVNENKSFRLEPEDKKDDKHLINIERLTFLAKDETNDANDKLTCFPDGAIGCIVDSNCCSNWCYGGFQCLRKPSEKEISGCRKKGEYCIGENCCKGPCMWLICQEE